MRKNTNEKQPLKNGISRRDFIKGAAAGLVSVSALGLLNGCSAGAEGGSQSSNSDTTAASSAETQTTAKGDEAVNAAKDEAIYEQGQYAFELTPDEIPEKEIVEELEYDIVICGAGQSGMLAALTAGKQGAKTLVLQKGSMVFTHGRICAMINTKFQKEINGKDFSVSEFTSDLLTHSAGRGNPQVIRAYFENSGETCDFINDLAEEYGLEARYDVYNEHGTEKEGIAEVGWTDVSKYHRQLTMIQAMEPIAKELGVDFRFDTPAVRLEKEGNRVTSVIAQDENENTYIRIKANKGVILCTGDIGGNPRMIEKYSSYAAGALSCYKPAYNSGDGHQMGLWIGAQMQKGNFANMIHLDPTPLENGDAPLSDYPFLAVNLDGERFMNEELVYQSKVNAALAQKEHTYFQIGGKGMPDFVRATKDIRNFQWDDAFERGAIVEGETIEELADIIGVPADNLKNAIERYDELAEAGEDIDFGKTSENFANTQIIEGPYYAIKRRPGILTILGGFVTTKDLQVLDTDDNIIEGLYAAGNTIGKYYGYDYPIRGTLATGHSNGRAMTFGRLAVKSALGLL